MKKVIHFSLANTRGGITQYVLNNWRYIDKKRFRFDMVTFGEKLDFQEELETDGCKVFYVKNRAEDDLDRFRDEISRILKEGYDAIHLHTSYWKSFELEKLAKQEDIPQIIIHSHNTGVYDDNRRSEKERQHYKLRNELLPNLATDFLACSERAAKWLYSDKILPEKIHILKNAVDIDCFAYDRRIREIYRRKLKWENEFIIGHIGRFSYQKNHEFLLNMFYKLTKISGNARLLLIGKGPLEENVKIMVRKYGLADKVYFAGGCDDVHCWFQAMDLFCLPSRFEGFPIVAVEAQASGVNSLISNTITQEVKIVENITYLPLDEEISIVDENGIKVEKPNQ